MEKFTVDNKNQQSINQLLFEGKFEEAQELLKKTMASEKEEKVKDTAEVLGGPRSVEAKKLAEKSSGKIILRPDGKVDFPELGIKGMGRLSVEGPTDLQNGLIQGDHVDQYNKKGVSGISYMTGERAMKEVAKQGKKLLPANGAEEKIKELLATLGSNGVKQSKALQALFGVAFSGSWNPYSNRWNDVGSASSVGLSEVNANGSVSSVTFSSSGANQYSNDHKFPQFFLVCENC